MIDTVSWIVNATLRPPRPSFTSILAPNNSQVAFNFTAQSNLDYVVQYRNSAGCRQLDQAAGFVQRIHQPVPLVYECSQRHEYPLLSPPRRAVVDCRVQPCGWDWSKLWFG